MAAAPSAAPAESAIWTLSKNVFHKYILIYKLPAALILTVRVGGIITINYQALFRHTVVTVRVRLR